MAGLGRNNGFPSARRLSDTLCRWRMIPATCPRCAAHFFGRRHDIASRKQMLERIERYSAVGARRIVMTGITMGGHALVAAGTIVTKDVQGQTIAAGNAA